MALPDKQDCHGAKVADFGDLGVGKVGYILFNFNAGGPA